MTVAIDNSRHEASQAAPPQAVQRQRADDTDSTTDPAESSLAFGVLMDALRSVTSPKAQRDPATSPNQMFDAKAADARGGRLSVLKSADQESRSLGSAPRGTDLTSVDARRADKAQQQRTESTGHTSFTVQADRGASESPALSTRDSLSPKDQSGDQTSRAEMRMLSAWRDGAPGGHAADKAAPARHPAQTLSAPDSAAPGRSIAVHVAPSTQGASEATTARTGVTAVAERIGEVLATGRTADVQAARAGGAVPPGSDPRGVAAKRSNGQTGTGEANGGGEGKVGTTSRGTAPGEFADLVKSIRMNVGIRRSSAKLQLNPPNLGRVRVDVQMKDNVLEITVRTESDEASAVLRERADMLRAAMEHYGIQIDRFDIEWHSGTNENAAQGDALGQPGPNAHSSRAVGGKAASIERASDGDESNASESSADATWRDAGTSRLDIRV